MAYVVCTRALLAYPALLCSEREEKDVQQSRRLSTNQKGGLLLFVACVHTCIIIVVGVGTRQGFLLRPEVSEHAGFVAEFPAGWTL